MSRRPTRLWRPQGEISTERVEELGEKYRRLCRKYRALAERYGAEVEAHGSGASSLAMAVLRASPSALAVLRDGRFLVRNRGWLALTRSRDEPWRLAPVDGTPGSRTYSALDALAREEGASLIASGRTASEDRFERAESGQTIEVRVERLARGETAAFVLVMARDVTERVHAERELARARELLAEQERMRAVGELASGVAHDLNNTLHAMGLRLAVLRGAETSAPAADEALAALARMVEEAAVRVGRLQEFARHRQDAPGESMDVRNVVADAIAIARPELEPPRTEGVIALDSTMPELPPVVGAAAELRPVFVHLFLNARDAMPRGGRIDVIARSLGERVEVTVADDGKGIPQEHLRRIFDPFFSTKGEKGTGLGLAVAYGVMNRLGGSISAANRPGGGAEFTLTFPVSRAAPGPPPAAKAPHGRRVLVVDDDSDNLEATRYVLEELGYSAEIAQSGRDALARMSSGERFDVVLCDVGMPQIDGWTVAAEIRGIAPEARVYMVSGWAHEIAADDPRRKTVTDVLPKPLSVEALARILAEQPTPPNPPSARASGSESVRVAPA